MLAPENGARAVYLSVSVPQRSGRLKWMTLRWLGTARHDGTVATAAGWYTPDRCRARCPRGQEILAAARLIAVGRAMEDGSA